ncbi:rna helicase [Moniliophthora roreri MCA 2997]|uniref:RNA helicase n=1 Tax=Moniliophthora roreri (strain MCA 2997) TaxID=1381753 RepID=V2XIA9_MONRO|nr:rna helicase [Moniliophthora roreri MCA 2997]
MLGTHAWKAHVSSDKHIKKTKSSGSGAKIRPESVLVVPGYKFCGICNRHVQNNSWKSHLQGKKHRASINVEVFTSGLDKAKVDKGGVTVTGNVDFGIVGPEAGKRPKKHQLTIQTTVSHGEIGLADFYTVAAKTKRKPPSPFTVVEVKPGHRQLTPKKPIVLSITAQQGYVGRSEDRLVLIFEDGSSNTRFLIARTLSIIVGDVSDHQALQPKVPYTPKSSLKRQPETKVIPGEPAPKVGRVPWVVSLPKSAIPADLLGMLSNEQEPLSSTITNIRNTFIPRTLNSATYSITFKYLLWIEEFKMDREMEQYDISSTRLERQSSFYYLMVPGLAEKRPSVLVGDYIRVHIHGSPEGKWFEGGVHVVRLEDVGLKFHKSFNVSPSDRVDVRFKLNRYPMRRQHQALDQNFSLAHVMFPSQAHIPSTVPNSQGIYELHNPLIAGNGPQLQAIASIVNRPAGSAPFVIFGPPGTGKTVTMVESILQILKKDSKAKILVCTPSNSAADLVVSRLRHDLDKERLFRLNAPSRFQRTVPEEIRPYTCPDGGIHYTIHSRQRVMEYQVVVSTCVSAAMVFGIGIPRGHYSHIFVDEAGQGTEPELMIPIRTMASEQTSIVLCGDPKQLGPVIRSSIARELGLSTSYLQRLMSMDVYNEQQGFGKSVVKLVKNFRSHPAIISYPNKRFYSGDLQACGPPEVINSYLGSKYLVSPKFPIVFHAVKGKDDREASSPSFFNIDEATLIKIMVKDLMDDRQKRIAARDIGVIAPYRAQVTKIRTLLKQFAEEVKVGSVEEFQGQERTVIIISCVRSSQDYINFDLKRTLGFVANPERFNVAVTRAKALLMIVGDPSVLGLDPLWRKFLNYVHENKGWRGVDIPWDPTETIDEAGGYDRAIRDLAQAEMGEFMQAMEDIQPVEDDEDDVILERQDTA